MDEEMKNSAEFRKKADEHLESVKSSIKSFLLTGVFVIAGVIVFVVLGLAWFAYNDKVKAGTSTISAKDDTIELRSYGSNGVHDDVLKKLLGTDGENGFWYTVISNDKLDTSTQMPSINWLLSKTSNMSNYSDEEVDWSDENNRRIDYAIEPGAGGDISFCVVPKISGDINVRFRLDMIPYSVKDGVFSEIPADDYVASELSGHILYFLKKSGSPAASLSWIEENIFEVKIENAEIDEEYPYTIHWSWPQIFSEIILSSGDQYLLGREPIYSEYANGSDIRTEIVKKMKTSPERFFYSSLTKAPLDTSYPELGYIDTIFSTTTAELLSAGNADAIQALVDLSSYYNQGDQYIGKNIDCIRVSLSAELINVEN